MRKHQIKRAETKKQQKIRVSFLLTNTNSKGERAKRGRRLFGQQERIFATSVSASREREIKPREKGSRESRERPLRNKGSKIHCVKSFKSSVLLFSKLRFLLFTLLFSSFFFVISVSFLAFSLMF